MQAPPARHPPDGRATDADGRNPRTTRPRLDFIDALRGIAIVAMVVFHLAWDLAYLGFYGVDVSQDPSWVGFERAILSSFMLLVGAGLVLGHGDGVRWPSFRRRFAMLAAASAAVTVSTLVLFPQTFIYFGVLHAILLFSLLGLPFLFLPARLTALAGIGIVIAAALLRTPAFNIRALSWIGFWTQSPPVNDLVPVFPWFGMVLIGIASTRWLRPTEAWQDLAGWRARGPARLLVLMGRWSLLIYLLHQPLMFGALQLLPAPPLSAEAVAERASEFGQGCQRTCAASGGAAPFCTAYCQCTLEQVEAGDLWATLQKSQRGAAEIESIDAMVKLCTAMAQ